MHNKPINPRKYSVILRLRNRDVTIQSNVTKTIDAEVIRKNNEHNPRAGMSTNIGLVANIMRMTINEIIAKGATRLTLMLNSANSQNL